MKNSNQRTITQSLLFTGTGLHSGCLTSIKLIPAPENTGIVFKRVDLKENNLVKADYKNVSSTKLCTILTNSDGITVSTVEHLMASFYITGVDNVLIEIDSAEVPIMDGSSKEFVSLIKKIGLKEQFAKRNFLKIIKKIELKDGNKFISIEPGSNSLDVKFKLEYENKIIGKQENAVSFGNSQLEDIYSSRTFCLFEDIEKIKNIGLAKGGSLQNAIVVKNNEVLNDEGLRNTKEFVNHKILDLAGDFLLSGYRILGKVECVQGGHQLSNLFLKEIFKNQSNYEEVTVDNIELIEKDFKTSINKIAVNA